MSSSAATQLNTDFPRASSPMAATVAAPPEAAALPPSDLPSHLREDNFVDFYDMLQVPLSSTEAELRKRISSLYLEAQKNQDHRNPQKKMFFQQMYEVYLPRARYLLLFKERRVKYDEHARTFRDDRAQQMVVAQAPADEQIATRLVDMTLEEATTQPMSDAPQEQIDAPQDVSRNAPFEVVNDELDVEVLAAQREILWKQWQESLDVTLEAPPPKPLVFTPEQAAREQVRNTFMHETAAVVREEERLRREESLHRQQQRWAEREKEQNEARLQTRAVEEREQQRRQQTVAVAHMARRKASLGSGAALFAVGSLLLFATRSGGTMATSSEETQALSQAQRPFHQVPAAVPGVLQSEDYDSGMESTAYHKVTPLKSTDNYRPGSGVAVTPTNKGYAVTNTAAGDWIEYSIDVAQSGNYDLGVDVASQNGGGAFEVSFNGHNSIGEITVPATGSEETYQRVDSKVLLSAGKQVMRLSFKRAAANGSAGNFDAISFRALPTNTSASATLTASFLQPLRWLALALFSACAGIMCGSLVEKRHLQKTTTHP